MRDSTVKMRVCSIGLFCALLALGGCFHPRMFLRPPMPGHVVVFKPKPAKVHFHVRAHKVYRRR